MTLVAPAWLLLGIGIALLAAGYVARQRRVPPDAVRLPTLGVLAEVVPADAGWRRHVPAVATLLALLAGVVGLAGPATVTSSPRGGVVMLAIDVSGSMDATDVSPTRLDAAVDAARSFLDDAPERVAIGLASFDDAGAVLAPPTTARTPVRRALADLETGPGTAAGEGLEAALDAVGPFVEDAVVATEPSTAIVLLADGDSTIGRPLLDAAEEAAARGVPVHTVAFGTSEGVVRIGGEPVPVPVATESLRQVASRTGGSFAAAASGDALRAVYDGIGERVSTEVELTDLTPLAVGLAAALLGLAAVTGLLWSPRLA